MPGVAHDPKAAALRSVSNVLFLAERRAPRELAVLFSRRDP
jgi:hypothetical protein